MVDIRSLISPYLLSISLLLTIRGLNGDLTFHSASDSRDPPGTWEVQPCILLRGYLSLTIGFLDLDQKRREHMINIPASAKAAGTCRESESEQILELNWGDEKPFMHRDPSPFYGNYSVKFFFRREELLREGELTVKPVSYLEKIRIAIRNAPGLLRNASGRIIHANNYWFDVGRLKNFSAELGHSFVCVSALKLVLSTENDPPDVSVNFQNVQIQAFRDHKTEGSVGEERGTSKNFSDRIELCSIDKENDKKGVNKALIISYVVVGCLVLIGVGLILWKICEN